ncbi:MAG: GNAT family N-acetyltransferase [Candidatus Brocadiaceae bacterium]|nr:GNAT family N-acetyltransferase [Candidatus Brocadiaceae bacterium]
MRALIQDNGFKLQSYDARNIPDDILLRWKCAVNSQSRKSYYHDYEYFKSYLDNLKKKKTPLEIFAASIDSRLFFLTPMNRVVRWFGCIPLHGLELPCHDHVPLCDIPVLDNYSKVDTLKMLIDYVSSKYKGKWDYLCFSCVAEESNLMEALRGTSLRLKSAFKTESCSYFDCSRDFQYAVAGTSSHFRRDLNRKSRRLFNSGHVDVRFERNMPGLLDAYKRFLKLEASGWKGAHGTVSAIGLHKELRDFYEQLMHIYGEKDSCIISLMSLDGRDIAGQFCIISGETVYVKKIGYDQEFKHLSPGNLLLKSLIEWCCNDEQLKYVNLITTQPWVQPWKPKTQDVYKVYLFKRTFPWIWILFIEKTKKLIKKHILKKQV